MEKSPESITSFLTFRHPISSLKDYKYPCEIEFNEAEIDFSEALDYVEDFIRLSVKELVEGSKRPAVVMSSGVDSVYIAHLVNSFQKAKVYTAQLEGDNEASNAKAIAFSMDLDHTLVKVEKEDYLEKDRFLKPLIEFKKEPLHPNEIALAKCEQKAKEDGCDIIFSGEGADDIFGGYSKIFTFYKNHFLSESMDKFLISFFDFYRYFSLYERRKIVKEPFLLDDINLTLNLFPELGRIRMNNFGPYFVQKIHTPGLIKRGTNAVLWNGLKPAFPYYNEGLIKFVNNLPLEYKIYGPISKFILRNVAQRSIGNLAFSEKHPFPIPFDKWMHRVEYDLNNDLFHKNNFSLLKGWKKWMSINLDIWWNNE